MAHNDPVEFGKLIASVEALAANVHELTDKVKMLDAKVEELSALRHKGIGVIFGLMISGGALGAAVAELWSKIK